jgi:predicted transcriptional regulator
LHPPGGRASHVWYAKALAEFVVSEEAFAAAVAEGRAAVDAGDVIDHDEVMREVDALLAKTK